MFYAPELVRPPMGARVSSFCWTLGSGYLWDVLAMRRVVSVWKIEGGMRRASLCEAALGIFGKLGGDGMLVAESRFLRKAISRSCSSASSACAVGFPSLLASY